MSQIHQIQFQYCVIEDRLLLKMNTTNKEEYRFLLTRRFVSLLYPILTKILHEHKSLAVQKNEQIRNEMISLQQQEVMLKTNTVKTYQDEAFTHPLGSEPILLTKIATERRKNAYGLTLEPEKGQGISFPVDHNLTHVLCHLLLECLEKTDWQLGYERDFSIAEQHSVSGKVYLH